MLHLLNDPTTLLVVQIATILMVSRVLGSLFYRLGQPVVVAEIVAGLAMGPSLLGILWPRGLELLFPPSSLTTLNVTAQLGLVLFMFVIGMEFDPTLLRGRARVAALSAASSVLVPFLAGIGLGYALHGDFAPEGVGIWPFSLFLGAAMCVTAFPVLARILSEHGLTRTELGALTMTAAAANDVAAWCILAFVVGVLQAGGALAAVFTTFYAGIFVAVMLLVVRPFMARLLGRFTTRHGISRTGMALLMILLFVSALISHAIGVHALFGAFVFGATVPRDQRLLRGLTLRIEDVVVLVFLPLFFAATGLRTEIGLIQGPEMWTWCAVIVGIATVSKIVGSAVPARLGGFPLRESLTFGMLMNTRGLMELILLEIGRSLGILPPVLFTMFVLMAVTTTLMTTPLVRLLYPRARVIAARAAAQATANHNAQPPVTAPASAVLTCISDPRSAVGLGQITAALALGDDSRAYALTLTSIQDRSTYFPDIETSTQPVEEPSSLLAHQTARAGVAISVLDSFPSADPGHDICEVARLKKVDMVVVGTHRPLLGHAVLGGPLVTIAREFEGDLAVLLDRGLERLRRVLVVRGGPHSAAVDRTAERLSRDPRIRLERMDVKGDPFPLVMAQARDMDLVLLGVDPKRGVAPHVIDLRHRRLLEDLPCSVLVVHGGDADD